MKLTGFDKKTKRPEFLIEMEDKDSVMLTMLGDSPTARVWQFIWEWRKFDYSFTDIAKCAIISRNSLYKIWSYFRDNEILIPTRREKGVQLYGPNKNSPLVKGMMNLLDTALKLHMARESAVDEAMDKIMKESFDKHGRTTKRKETRAKADHN